MYSTIFYPNIMVLAYINTFVQIHAQYVYEQYKYTAIHIYFFSKKKKDNMIIFIFPFSFLWNLRFLFVFLSLLCLVIFSLIYWALKLLFMKITSYPLPISYYSKRIIYIEDACKICLNWALLRVKDALLNNRRKLGAS